MFYQLKPKEIIISIGLAYQLNFQKRIFNLSFTTLGKSHRTLQFQHIPRGNRGIEYEKPISIIQY